MSRRRLTVMSVAVLCVMGLSIFLDGVKVLARALRRPNRFTIPTRRDPPADLPSELLGCCARWIALKLRPLPSGKLPRPRLTGQPPIFQNTGVASVEILGKLMNYDRKISPYKNTACASCHMPYAGLADRSHR